MSSLHPESTHRLPVSCENCRRRKIRCIGAGNGPPCATCSRRGYASTCRFKRQLELPHTPSNTEVDTQIASLSALLKQNIEATTALLHQQQQPVTPQSDVVLDPSCHESSTPQIADANANTASASAPARVGQLMTSASDHVRFVPFQEVGDASLLEALQGHGPDETSGGFPFFMDNVSSQTRVLLDLLPPASQCDQLVGIFLDVISPLFHILHDRSFLAKYQVFSNDRLSVTPSFLALIFVQLALAVTTLDDESPILQDLGHESCPSANVRNLATRYRAAAMRCLVADNFMWHHNLCTVQSLVLLIYAISHAKGPSWTLLGSALHIAVAIGCSVDPIHLNVGLIEAEERRRCWAALKMLYTIQNTCLGNITPFKLEDNVALPADVDDDVLDAPIASTIEQETSASPTKMTYILYKFRLYNLAYEICRLSSQAQVPEQDAVNHLEARLRAERRCHMERFTDFDALPVYHVAHFYILSNYSHHLSLLLYRPQLTAFQLKNAGYTAKDHFQDCKESALTILSNFEMLCTNPDFRPYKWYNYGLGSFHAFLAIVSLVAILSKTKSAPEETTLMVEAISSCLQILQQAAKRSEICAKVSSILSSVTGDVLRMREDETMMTLIAEDTTTTHISQTVDDNVGSETFDSSAPQLDSFLQTIPCEQWLIPAAFPWST